MPDMSGMWYTVPSVNSYHEILMGEYPISEERVVCHEVRPSWMMGPATMVTNGPAGTMTMNLHSTNELVDDGCKIELNAGLIAN